MKDMGAKTFINMTLKIKPNFYYVIICLMYVYASVIMTTPESCYCFVLFEVLTAVSKKNAILWAATPWSLVEIQRLTTTKLDSVKTLKTAVFVSLIYHLYFPNSV
jgi:hypothetical protein